MIELGINSGGVDERDILTSRSCIIAQSGAGKSYGVAVLCEQLAKLSLGFCVIDTEGEYFTLKQGFDVLWVGGAKSDLDVSRVDLKKLALRVVKDSVPLIFDVSEVDDERKFVNDFVTALYEVESDLRLPYLLVVEEADKFIPQRGEKLTVLYDVARRGRKRGLGLLVASQRPALVDKEVLSQCNHQFIGKLTVENDIDSARYFFNSRKNLLSLPDLMPGEFFMSGFGPEESKFKFRERVTKHEGVTPELIKREPVRIRELVESLGLSDSVLNGVEALISKEDAELIAFNNCRRRLVFIGEKEVVEGVSFFYRPLIELGVRVLRKSVFSSEFVNSFAYFTPEYGVVNDRFDSLFDLSFMKGLPVNSVRVLIALLYGHARTLGEVMSSTGLNEADARTTLKALVDSGFISHSGWRGKYKVYVVVRKVSVPRVASLCVERLDVKSSVNVEDLKFNVDDFKQVIKSLDSKADVVGAKVIYYPFFKAVLRAGEVSRDLLINAVTGKVS